MVDNTKEQPILGFQDKDGNQRDIYEKDLTDINRPIVQQISQDLNSEKALQSEYEKALKTVHHMESVRRNIQSSLRELEDVLPPYKKPIVIEGADKGGK